MRIKGKHKMTERYSNLMKKKIFHIELENGIYLLSSTEFGTDTAMGTPTANSYLVVGEKKAVLIDLAVDGHTPLCRRVGSKTAANSDYSLSSRPYLSNERV